jgi:hypothetical protein
MNGRDTTEDLLLAESRMMATHSLCACFDATPFIWVDRFSRIMTLPLIYHVVRITVSCLILGYLTILSFPSATRWNLLGHHARSVRRRRREAARVSVRGATPPRISQLSLASTAAAMPVRET